MLVFKGFPPKTKVKCDECGSEDTVEDINADKVRYHLLHGRKVCECCHEDLTDKERD
jgi:hypothetical protein